MPVGLLCLSACGGGHSKHRLTSPTTLAPFVATDAGFSAVFPTVPRRQVLPVQQPGASLSVILYEATTNNEQVAVAFTSLPGTLAGPVGQAGLDGAVDAVASNARGTVVTRANATYLDQPAEDGVIAAPGTVLHVRVVFFGARRYLLEGITSTEATPHPQFDVLLATFKNR